MFRPKTRGDGAAPGLIYNHHRTEFPSPIPVCRLIDGQLCFLPCTLVGVLLFRECNYMLIQPGQHVCLSGLSENSRVVSGDLSNNALHYITNFSSHSHTHTVSFFKPLHILYTDFLPVPRHKGVVCGRPDPCRGEPAMGRFYEAVISSE